MMNFIKNGNWGLKILSLALAIVIYHTLKNGTATNGRNTSNNDRQLFHSR